MEVPSIFLNRILAEAAKKGASDLHLTAGSSPMIRLGSELVVLAGAEIVTAELLNKIIETILEPAELTKFKEQREIVLVKNLAANFRFRVNIFQQKDLPALTFHYIPAIIKSLADLNLPSVTHNFALAISGLLVVAGPYSSGRTTTIAALIEEINQAASKSIITLEDPIEFLFVSKKSIIAQRQIGRDVRTFSQGLDYCLREDVDAVYVSEISREEEFAAAAPLILELAAGNCLVIWEINADSSVKALERILSAVSQKFSFESASYNLTDILLGVITQKLMPRRGGGLALAVEILLNNSAVKSLIREGKFYQLESIMQTSRGEGMISLAKSIEQLVQAGEVRPEDAKK